MRISCRGLGASGLGPKLPTHGPLPETAAEFEPSDRRKRIESWLTKPGHSAQNPLAQNEAPPVLQRPAALRRPKCCGIGGRRYGQAEN